MKIKYSFALLVPFMFVALAACLESPTEPVEIVFKIPCVGPPPIIDSLAGAEFNGACPYRMWWNDTLATFHPGVGG